MLLYSCHFFWNRTQMNGALQSAFYGATSVGIASAVALVCGAAGYAGASAFVRRVYSAVKTD